MGEVEIRIVRDHQIQPAVAIVIQESATAAPRFSVSGHSGLLGYLFERPSAIVVEPVLSVIGDVEIFPAVVVIVADTNALTPAGSDESRTFRHVRECSVMIVMIEVVRRRASCREAFQGRAIHKEDIRPAIVVVIEDGYACSRALQDVSAALFASEDIRHGETGFLGDVCEVGDRRGFSRRMRGLAVDYLCREERQKNAQDPTCSGAP